jgi:hypothetical protein
MHVTLPNEKLGKLENHGAMGYLMGYKYKGAYHVWIPCIGVKEVRDVTFLEGAAPVLPDHGSIAMAGSKMWVRQKQHLYLRHQLLRLHNWPQEMLVMRRMEHQQLHHWQSCHQPTGEGVGDLRNMG